MHSTILNAALAAALLCSAPHTTQAQIVLSGNENKIDLAAGEPLPVLDAAPDSISAIDFAEFPPRVQHLPGISNSVIGPPSNIAITPDGTLALIASSLQIDRDAEDPLVPDHRIHLLDLTSDPPQRIGQVAAGKQPSGISITSDGRLALVANRAAGTVSVLRIRGQQVDHLNELTVGEPADNVSDVAISPDDRLALVSVNTAGHLRVLAIETGPDSERVVVTDRKLATYGGPYRTVITPDGELGLTAGAGQGAVPDTDALTVVDLTADPIRTIDYVPIGSGPESIEISPDGQLLAAVLMNGSNLPADAPGRTEAGLLVLLARRGKTFDVVQQEPIGRVPEGVAFTADGQYLLVQCHPAREIWVFRVDGDRATDTEHRVKVPGMPSSLRAVPLHN